MSKLIPIRSFPSLEEARPALTQLESNNLLCNVGKDASQLYYTLSVAEEDAPRAQEILGSRGFSPIPTQSLKPEALSDESHSTQESIESDVSDQQLLEIREAMQVKQKSLTQKLIILAISAAVFYGAGLLRGSITSILLILTVLLIHETGHWIGMKIFGYKDVQMFFIPGFGAAVSEQSRRLAPVKKRLSRYSAPYRASSLESDV